jgi:hypothetical protein
MVEEYMDDDDIGFIFNNVQEEDLIYACKEIGKL